MAEALKPRPGEQPAGTLTQAPQEQKEALINYMQRARDIVEMNQTAKGSILIVELRDAGGTFIDRFLGVKFGDEIVKVSGGEGEKKMTFAQMEANGYQITKWYFKEGQEQAALDNLSFSSETPISELTDQQLSEYTDRVPPLNLVTPIRVEEEVVQQETQTIEPKVPLTEEQRQQRLDEAARIVQENRDAEGAVVPVEGAVANELRRGSTGKEVEYLQEALNACEFRDAQNRNLVITGTYDEATEQAVMSMQRFLKVEKGYDVQITGVYDIATETALNAYLDSRKNVADNTGPGSLNLLQHPAEGELVETQVLNELHMGMDDPRVIQLKIHLNALHMNIVGQPLDISNGLFDEKTMEALIKLQNYLSAPKQGSVYTGEANGIYTPELERALNTYLSASGQRAVVNILGTATTQMPSPDVVPPETAPVAPVPEAAVAQTQLSRAAQEILGRLTPELAAQLLELLPASNLGLHSSGPDVEALQRILNEVGIRVPVTGRYGHETVDGVHMLEVVLNELGVTGESGQPLKTDGIYGPETRSAMQKGLQRIIDGGAGAEAAAGQGTAAEENVVAPLTNREKIAQQTRGEAALTAIPTTELREGMTGQEVASLKALLGMLPIPAEGATPLTNNDVYDSSTTEWVARMQQWLKGRELTDAAGRELEVDGIFHPETAYALGQYFNEMMGTGQRQA